ncbi:DUF1801 domain-containing protein [Woodsholea maritima]|uniref:DUF1801 domain-containing protein n=1 Tax=Woodsholea maritima TaxID=240237 RepID=UPI00035C5FC4|nr:DUF1801 domain-containing protein [Woodsholea maritima]
MSDSAHPPSALIDQRIADLDDWRGPCLARMRALILKAEPAITEDWKWRGVPVWYHQGMICTGESYKDKIKLTFVKGARLPDPKGLFNASLEGNTRRAIDIFESDVIDEAAFLDLMKAALDLNAAKPAKPTRKTKA